MNLASEPRHLPVRAHGERSPLYTAEGEGHDDLDRFTRILAPDVRSEARGR